MSEDQASQNHVGIKDLFWEWIQDDMSYLQFVKNENKFLQQLREKFPDNQVIVMLCREAISENDRIVKYLIGRIADVEHRIKEFK